MLLQSYRSAAWIEGEIRQAEAERAMLADEATPELLERLVMTHEIAIKLALSAFRNSISGTAHLQTRIILNRTATPFFTSDDPVIYTNRFHLQKDVLGGAGIGSPGAMLVMPLAPHLMLLSFDSAIYRLDKRFKALGVIDRASDVAAFNDLQAVRGHANLYFRDWSDRALVASIYEKAKPRRRDIWFDVETLQETEAGSNTFVAVTGRWVHYLNGGNASYAAQRSRANRLAFATHLYGTRTSRPARCGSDPSLGVTDPWGPESGMKVCCYLLLTLTSQSALLPLSDH